MLITKYLNISLQFYLCDLWVSINTVKMKHYMYLFLFFLIFIYIYIFFYIYIFLYVSWVSFGDRLWLWLIVWYKTIVFKSLFERLFTLYYEKKGFSFFPKSAWLLLFFLTLLKCNCKLISDVGFYLCLFDGSASSFFHWPTNGLCHFQLLSWSHWLESIQKKENVLFQNMWLIELRRWRIRYMCVCVCLCVCVWVYRYIFSIFNI